MKSFFRSLLLRSLALAGLTGAVAQAAGSGQACCQKSPAACCATASGCGDSTKTKVASTDTTAYPLDTCVVSGDKLEDGDMGPPIDYTYQQAGQPDRLVRLCCKSCIKTFNKDPEKYLKLIDDATKAQGVKPAEAAPTGH